MSMTGRAKAALTRRLRDLRRNPGRAVTAELDWMGTAALERLGGGEPAVIRFRNALYRGRRVECPVCGGRYRHFKPDWNRPDAICPGCQSQERHRAIWLYFSEHPEILARPHSLLHFAPEPLLEARLRDRAGLHYVSADLNSPLAMDHVDVTALPYQDATFDAIICSHVLEHVPDDRKAMAEMLRVLRPGGWALILVPVDFSRSITLEDPSIVTPDARKAAYRQEDHVRLYGTDLSARLDDSGFATSVVAYSRDVTADVRVRYGLSAEDEFYFAYRPHSTGQVPSSPEASSQGCEERRTSAAGSSPY